MAKKKVEDTLNLDSILFKCRDILRKARNSGSFFEKRDMMLTLVFLRFIGEKFDDGIEALRQKLIEMDLDPDDDEIRAAFFDDATFTDGTYNLPIEARWSTIINTEASKLNVALDTALTRLDESSTPLKGCFVKDPPHNCAQPRHIIPADPNFEKKRNSSALFAREINLVTQPSFDCEQGINSQVQTACSNADAVFPVLGNERFSLSRKTHVPLWNEPRISHVRLL